MKGNEIGRFLGFYCFLRYIHPEKGLTGGKLPADGGGLACLLLCREEMGYAGL